MLNLMRSWMMAVYKCRASARAEVMSQKKTYALRHRITLAMHSPMHDLQYTCMWTLRPWRMLRAWTGNKKLKYLIK
eukprot:scaffold197191_cov33-Prasinocladus_malaysianus.AAC.2